MARKAVAAVTVARREKHREDTRSAILNVARRTFARKGFADTSLEDIVAPARLTKGALYHHFESKAALLEALYVDMSGNLLETVGAAVQAAPPDAWSQAAAAIDAFFVASAEPDYVRIVLQEAPLVLGFVHGRDLDQQIGLPFVIRLVESLRDAGQLPATLPIVATARMLLAVTGEMAIAMAHAPDATLARKEGTQVVMGILEGFRALARARSR
jgi:AcrR family transcriptional regulator